MILQRVNEILRKSAAIGALLFVWSCSVNGPLREDVKASGFEIGKAPKLWIAEKPEQSKDSDGADVVFQDRTTKSLIGLNSLCFRYESTSLERLAHQYESGLKESETLSEDEIKVDGRSAVRVHLKGDFDGVRSEILVTVVRKNDCLFDFTLVGVSPLAPDLVKDFDGWVQEFRYSAHSEKKVAE